MVVFLLHIKIRDAFRRINPDLRISAARFDYEVVLSLLLPQKTCGVSATGFTQKRHTL